MNSKKLFQIAAAALASVGLAAVACPDAYAQQVFFDDFDGGLTGGTWSTQNVSTSDPGSHFGSNAYYFNGAGGSGTGDRFAATSNLNLVAGAVRVSFLLRYEGTTGAFMEADVDATNYDHIESGSTDSILLQYSTDGGANWSTVTTFADNSDAYNNTASASFFLPSPALASSVSIRVWQDGTNVGTNRDEWAIDDFSVIASPEPGTLALLGLGTAAMGAWVSRRRTRRRKASASARAADDSRPA